MKLAELAKLLEAELLCREDKLDDNITFVCAGDLMSDILVFSQPHALLITGLVSLQVIRTAEMVDIAAIVLIRSKKPTDEMVELAKSKGIPLLTTPNNLYSCCGLLYEAGLKNQSILA